MRKNNNSELKKRALLAKQRLKMGGMYRENASPATVYVRHEPSAILSVAQDEALYKRVCSILSDGDDISNPIGKLVDEKIYNQLDETGKQRYILQLSAKFRELCQRYYDEKAAH